MSMVVLNSYKYFDIPNISFTNVRTFPLLSAVNKGGPTSYNIMDSSKK